MKKVQVVFSIILSFMLIFSFTGQNLAFAKDDGHHNREGEIMQFKDSNEAVWAKDYISQMISKDIFKGYNDGSFRPNKPLNKVEAIVTAVRLMGFEDEAKAKTTSQDNTLYFKDAKLFDAGHKYSWARGYIIVALENGLFDSSVDMVQPQKAASRVWVASVLVRALGLQSEALSNMTATLDFKDADAIPAGAIGYVKVAVDNDLITGYADGTFKPNKAVTRAEMAALLDRTNEVLLTDSGATTVMGQVTAINFDHSVTEDVYGDSSVTEDVYGENSVTEDVYGQALGSISIDSFSGDSLTYSISPELLVQYHDRFITANQLLVGDLLSAVVKDNTVVEANLLDKDKLDSNVAGIREFKVNLEGIAGEYKLSYKNSKGRVRAEIKAEGHENRITGQEATNKVETILTQLDLKPDMSKEEVKNNILSVLNFNESDLKQIEIKIAFSNGKVIKIESEQDGINKDSKGKASEWEENKNNSNSGDENNSNDGTVSENTNNINDFQLKITFSDSKKGYWNYENDKGKVKAFIQDGSDKLSGDKAATEFEQLLNDMSLTADMSNDETINAVLSALNVDKDNVKALELEVKFADHHQLKVSYGNEHHRH